MEDTKAARYSAFLVALAEKQGGELSAEDVLNAAKPENSVLHDYFEWSDKRAAHLYRLDQARALIRTCYVVVRDEMQPERTVRVRQFEHVEGKYRPIEDALRNASWRNELLQRIARELSLMRQRYAAYAKMGAEFEAIDRGLAALEAETRTGESA